jgi:hypothetical protein
LPEPNIHWNLSGTSTGTIGTQPQRCSNCHGYHGTWNGRAVNCVNLQAGFCQGLTVTL